MTIGSAVNHVKFGNGLVKDISNDMVIVDFGKFDITFTSAEALELLASY